MKKANSDTSSDHEAKNSGDGVEEWLEWRDRWTRWIGGDEDGGDKGDGGEGADEVRKLPVQPAEPPPLSKFPGLAYLSNQHLACWLKVAAAEPAPGSPAKKSSGSAKESSDSAEVPGSPAKRSSGSAKEPSDSAGESSGSAFKKSKPLFTKLFKKELREAHSDKKLYDPKLYDGCAPDDPC